MVGKTLIGLVTLSAFALGFQPAHAQSTFKSGYYEINSGLYTECCGFAGIPFDYEVPDERQQFVELIINPGGTTAKLTFLGPDLQTVFTSYPWVAGRTFAFSFNDGIVLPDRIQFGDGPPVRGGVADWFYVVRDAGGGSVGISGTAITPMFGADVPNQFKHTNVVATLLTNPVVIDRIHRDGDSMFFHFTGQQLYIYTVEYSDSLTNPNWQTNSTHIAKLGPADVVVTNTLSAAQTRYFRIRTEPCYCR